MKPMIQLHLETDSTKPEAVNLPIQGHEEEKPIVLDDKVHRTLYHTGHKPGAGQRQSGSGIFSK
jgi:hypothetical protein